MSVPTNSKVILEAQGIVKVLGSAPNEVKVLKGIDLELHTGELTLLMGPSCSGSYPAGVGVLMASALSVGGVAGRGCWRWCAVSLAHSDSVAAWPTSSIPLSSQRPS